MIINAKLIGKRIKEVRTARKMPQMLLAEKCDISDSYLRTSTRLTFNLRTPIVLP